MSGNDKFAVTLILTGFSMLLASLLMALYGIWGSDSRWFWTAVVVAVASYVALSVGAAAADRYRR